MSIGRGMHASLLSQRGRFFRKEMDAAKETGRGPFEPRPRSRTLERLPEGVAEAEPHVVRGDVLELHRIEHVVGAVGGDQIAGAAVAEIEIAVGKLERQRVRDLKAKAGIEGPGEVPFVVGARICDRRESPPVPMPMSLKAPNLDVGDTSAGTHEGAQAVPGSEIEIHVGKRQPLGLLAEVGVGERASRCRGQCRCRRR